MISKTVFHPKNIRRQETIIPSITDVQYSVTESIIAIIPGIGPAILIIIRIGINSRIGIHRSKIHPTKRTQGSAKRSHQIIITTDTTIIAIIHQRIHQVYLIHGKLPPLGNTLL